MIFTKTLMELITSGTSGLSSARVALETATSIAELRAEKALMRIYITLASRTSWGTKVDENCWAAPTKMILRSLIPQIHMLTPTSTNQQHLATDSLSHTPQSVPFCPLLPKPPGPLGAGAHTSISPEPAELRGHSVKSGQRNQIARSILPGGWPGPCLFHPPHGTSRVKDKTPF
jgi:hypothetical protein